jgi:hypothetical protein
MPCTVAARGTRTAPLLPPFVTVVQPNPPFNDVTDNNPCGRAVVATVGGVNVSAESLCLSHWIFKHGLADLRAANAAITATAGTPGSWGPAGTTVPATPADLIAASPVAVTASPGTAWTTGQYVQTQTAGVGGRAYWNGTAWVAGTAP